MNPIKPIYVMRQRGVSEEQYNAALAGIKEVLAIAQVQDKIPLVDLDAWRSDHWLDSNGLRPYHSVDWYILQASNKRREGGLHIGYIMQAFQDEPWKGQRDHYDVLIVKEYLYDHEAYFMVGGAAHELAAVISTYRFTSLEPLLQSEVLKTATMHEVGHIFGLLPESRTNNVEYLLGKHCLNACIMRQGPRVPYD